MPDRRSPTAAQLAESRAEALAREAAERAARLALADSEKATKLAVQRALRDAEVDHRLRDHDQHLEAINGSQAQMATSLGELRDGQQKLISTHERQAAANEAVAEAVEAQGRRRLNRWERVLAIAGVFAAYGGIIATIFAATS